MSLQNTTELLRKMRLSGFLSALKEQMASTQYQDLSFEQRVSFLIEAEFNIRETRRLHSNLKQAKLKQNAQFEEIDFETQRGIQKDKMLQLFQASWIQHKQNIIITGPTGIGKSFIACAIANRLCRMGYTALYKKTSDLLSEILMAKADGSYPKLVKNLNKANLLILDEWLRDPLNPTQARQILDILDDRYQNSSTLFASQISVSNWHSLFQDPTIADAVLDRIIHNAIRFSLAGESMRKKSSIK